MPRKWCGRFLETRRPHQLGCANTRTPDNNRMNRSGDSRGILMTANRRRPVMPTVMQLGVYSRAD